MRYALPLTALVATVGASNVLYINRFANPFDTRLPLLRKVRASQAMGSNNLSGSLRLSKAGPNKLSMALLKMFTERF